MYSRNYPARVAIVMGSKSDWATMQFAAEIFEILNVPHHVEVVSAHRTPDKLFTIVQMPSGIPVGPLAIGKAGAANAALLSAQIRATHDKELNQRLNDWRKANTDEVMENPDPRGAA